MKKGLLTLLAASLVFVGCQNYDDQFDDLNAQISALKSQVDGLSSISGQVASLSGTISGLQAGVAAAQSAANAASSAATAATAAVNAIPATDLSGLEASLATLAAEVDAVQASLATAATSAEVTALQAELDAIEADVDELLSSSNIYSTAISVTSASTLDAALALGNKVNILNANATFTVTAAMDQTKVQTLVDRIKTMTGNLVFNSSSTTETTFKNLTSAEAITVNQKGGYQFPNLISAGAITLNDQYEANITTVDFASLATVTSFTTTGETNAGIQFDQATDVKLSKLARYPGGTSTSAPFTIITKKGASLDMPLLDDKNTLGVFEATHLTLNGPSSFTSTLLDDSNMSFTNVATVNVSNNRGAISINAGVVTLTLTDVVEVSVAATADDLVTATIDFKEDDEPTLNAAALAALDYDADAFVADDKGDIDLTTLANLKTVTITGDSGDINIDQNPNLETVTINADAMDLYLVDNDNMTSVTTTGSKFEDVEVSGHADLVTLTLDYTTQLRKASLAAAADTGASLNVNSNPSLTTLVAKGDDLDVLKVYTNVALTSIDFTGLADDGSSTTASVWVFDNDLTFDLVKDEYNDTTEDATYVARTLTDDGSTTGGGGLKTLKTYLQHVDSAANADNGIYVFVDNITKYEVQGSLNGVYTDTAVPSAPSVTSKSTAWTNRTSLYAIAAIEAAETTTVGTTVRETQTVVIPVLNNALGVQESVLADGEGVTITIDGVAKTFDQGDTYNGSTVTTLANLISYIHGDTTWGSDITVSASNAGYFRSNQEIKFTQGDGSAGAVSTITGGNSGGNDLWYKLGSTPVSGTITLANGAGASLIAEALADAISGYTNTAGAYVYGATANGAIVTLTKRVSDTSPSYPDDITSGVTSMPTIEFVIDAAQTSTTIGLDAGATSNLASLNLQGATSGFFLTVAKNDVKGINIKIVNNDNTDDVLGSSVVTNDPSTGSGILGQIGINGTASETQTAGPLATMLVSGTHFNGPNTAYAAVFADVSTATTSVSQAAATTNRTGWL
ncbi:MAG: hypothetical protein O3A49_05335 [Candidatus Marinimicrobia bacterium]|nr:hypothetical protein [Candidatus Neomarinimicrobiota bacterium]